MTYKYYEVRREIYDKCSDKSLRAYRSIKGVRKIFKMSGLAIILLMFLSMGAFLFLAKKWPDKPYCLIAIFVSFGLSIYMEFCGEKLYNPTERKKELSKHSQTYEAYIQNIKDALTACGIKNAEQREALKKECEEALQHHRKSFDAACNRILDGMIWAPIGALVTSFMHPDDIWTVGAVAVIILGLLIAVCVQGIKILRYYSDGHFKDQYLLNVLNELEYNA